MVELAIEMGLTENAFSSVTNIFGLTGLVLYTLLLVNITWTLFRGYKLSPPGSDARALCEFSLVYVLTAMIFCCYSGFVPGINLIYSELGILAARPYLPTKRSANDPAKAPAAPEIPAFARPAFSRQTSAGPGGFRPIRS
jgi:hypothetical protein